MYYHKGWDSFTVEPGKWPITTKCKICGDDLDVKLTNGPTSFTEAMTSVEKVHYHYTCSNAGADWHNQVYLLRVEAERTPLKMLESHYLSEADQIAVSRIPTKKVNPYSC